MARIKIEKFDIDDLFNFIKRKKLAIPEFQREFVWNEKKIRELFDSLIKNYPIGSFIIWKTSKEIEQRCLFVKEKSRQKYLVLDGQQRMLSLYYLCQQRIFNQMRDDFEEVCEHFVDFSRFYFDPTKRKPQLTMISKRDQFNYSNFRKRLKRYRFPLIIVDVDEYEEAIEMFEKINQSGTRISTEAIFLSDAWNKRTNLGRQLRQWKHKNREKLTSKLDNILFIHALAIVIQMDEDIDEFDPEDVDISQRELKNIAKLIKEEPTNKYERILGKIISSMENAMGFLRDEFGILSVHELPSQTMLTVLCIFFYFLNRSEISETQLFELKKWFWRTAMSSRYVGVGYHTHLRTDPFRMKKLARNSLSLRIKPYTPTFDEIKNLEIRAGRSSLKNALKLMLWLRKPIWITGDKITKGNIETNKRKKEDDHFYAYDFFKKGYIEENDINSILNLLFLPKTVNCAKYKALPSVWLRDVKDDQKISRVNEESFFDKAFLPFESVKELEDFEDGLLYRDGKVKKLLLREAYQDFLQKRYQRFEKEIKSLQEGR
jgi:hypothetical protein